MKSFPDSLTLWLFLCVPLCAQESPSKERVAGNVSARFHSVAGISRPLVELPRHVPMKEGEVFLWADFQADPQKGVPLYLVNATNEARVFESQDNDLYFKLEYQDEKGVWRRAQAHLSSWCGNSYFSVSLPGRHYFEFMGYRPAKGTEKVVRYANPGQKLHSNEGLGVITEEDLWAVAHDSLTESEVPFEWRRAIDLKANSAPPDGPALVGKLEALRALSWLPRNEPLIEQMHAFHDWVKSSIPGPEGKTLLKEMDTFFKRVDEAKPARVELLRLCIRVLARKEKAVPEMSSDTAWHLLGLAFRSWENEPKAEMLEIPIDEWQAIIGPAEEYLKLHTDTTQARRVAAKVLSTAWIVDSVVPNQQLEDWLLSSSPSLRGIGAGALARRSQFARLVEIGRQRPGPEQIVILKALTRLAIGPDGHMKELDTVRRPGFSTGEADFWSHCASTMPLETATALWSYHFIHSRPPFDRLIHEPLRDFWKAEAVNSTKPHELPDQGYRHDLALNFLHSWRMEEDDEIFTALLNHGGYIEWESLQNDGVNVRVVTRKFPIREFAKNALLSRYRAVPGDLITEEVISKTPVPETEQQKPSQDIAPPITKRRVLIPQPEESR